MLRRLPVAHRVVLADAGQGNSQARGNSGVFFMGFYELQILDSYDNETYVDGQAGRCTSSTRRW